MAVINWWELGEVRKLFGRANITKIADEEGGLGAKSKAIACPVTPTVDILSLQVRCGGE
jgi:hypothetical protein